MIESGGGCGGDESPNNGGGGGMSNNAACDILVLKDLFTAGYHSAAHDRLDECGLDFNHRYSKTKKKEKSS